MNGQITLSKPLTLAQYHYLKAFGKTRRMKRNIGGEKDSNDPIRVAVGLPVGPEGGYVVHNDETRSLVLDHNRPPEGQYGLWCQWYPSKDGLALYYGGEKHDGTYGAGEWLKYLIQHFLIPWGIVANGRIYDQDEEEIGILLVQDNQVVAITPDVSFVNPFSGKREILQGETFKDENGAVIEATEYHESVYDESDDDEDD